jgi:hypothetical protein
MDRDAAADILGVAVDAPDDDIRRQYKYLARVLHPDKSGSTALFQRVAEAHEVMTGPPPPPPPAPQPRPRPRPPPAAFVRRARPPAPPPLPREYPSVPVGRTPPRTVNHSWPSVSETEPVPAAPSLRRFPKVREEAARLTATVDPTVVFF